MFGISWSFSLQLAALQRISGFVETDDGLWAVSDPTSQMAQFDTGTAQPGPGPATELLVSGSLPLLLDPVFSSGGGLDFVFATDRIDGQLVAATILPGATSITLQPVDITNAAGFGFERIAGVETPVSDAVRLAATSSDGALSVIDFDPASGDATILDQIFESEKAGLDSVSDIATVDIGGQTLVLTTSSGDTGLTSFALDDAGQIELIDTLGMHDGLWANGLDAVATANSGGTTFALASSAASGMIFSVRVNPIGALFLADSVTDDRFTRFDAADALESFEHMGRTFVLSGGGDDGLTLFELAPDGRLDVLTSVEQTMNWAIGNIDAIHVEVGSGSARAFVSGESSPLVAVLDIPMDDLGPLVMGTGAADTLTGTSADDLLFGGAGNDSLYGADGDDRLMDGAGSDVLTGGVGADMFICASDGAPDQIADFEKGTDRIDLRHWGRIYDHSALDIQQVPQGATISFGNETLTIATSAGGPIDTGSWGNDDFIF